MTSVPSRIAMRISAGLKRFQPILTSAHSRDVNESDTVVIVTDLLQEVFGYDKYTDITSEHIIRGTFCDLAIKLDGEIKLLIEVKAIGLELKDSFVKQATDYAANQGVEWVALTNGVTWRVYKVTFSKPIESELVVEYNLCDLNPKNPDHLELVWLLAKESWQKARLGEYHSQRQALSRFSVAAIILSDSVIEVVRREIKRISPGIKIELQDIGKVLRKDVLKREVLEGEKAEAAQKHVQKAAARALRAAKSSRSTVGANESKVSNAPAETMPNQNEAS